MFGHKTTNPYTHLAASRLLLFTGGSIPVVGGPAIERPGGLSQRVRGENPTHEGSNGSSRFAAIFTASALSSTRTKPLS